MKRSINKSGITKPVNGVKKENEVLKDKREKSLKVNTNNKNKK